MENNPKTSLHTRVDFKSLRENGQRIQPCSWLVVFWLPGHPKKGRILWNLSRKVANSVVRNRLKRRVREFIRVQLKDVVLDFGLDLNVVFRPNHKDFYKDLRRADIDKELYRIEKKIRDRLRKGS